MRPGADAGTVYLCCQPVDFRKSISGLAVLIEQGFDIEPLVDWVDEAGPTVFFRIRIRTELSEDAFFD